MSLLEDQSSFKPRPCIAGDVVLVELAVAFLPSSALRSGSQVGSPSAFCGVRPNESNEHVPRVQADFTSSLRFTGPFDACKAAAVRVAAQLEARLATFVFSRCGLLMFTNAAEHSARRRGRGLH
jgi:hypothetical protein